MSPPSLQASQSGTAKIKEQIDKRRWKVSETDTRPLKEASVFFVEQYADLHQLQKNDRKWLLDFKKILRIENDQDIDEIKRRILQSQSGSIFESIKNLINEGEIFAKGISYGTWKRFTSGEPINENNFKIYCHVLDLDWQEIVSLSDTPSSPILTTKTSYLYNNLPTPNYTRFIGRERELNLLLELLSPNDHTHRISIEGMGGTGKTTLAIEAAYRCLNASQDNTEDIPHFDAIILTTSQQKHLKTRQILPRYLSQRTVNDTLAIIAETLNLSNFFQGDLTTQIKRLQQQLRQFKTLLIIDNLETHEDVEDILAFLYELPPSLKVILTSREKVLLDNFRVISLSSLTKTEGLQLIQHYCQNQEQFLNLEQANALYEKTGGIPAAIIYAIGKLSAGYSLQSILPSMTLATADFSRFFFESSITSLKEKLAHKILMILAIFPKPATAEAIINIINVSKISEIEESLAQLQQLSLIKRQEHRYTMLPLTRGYALTELDSNQTFEREIRHRWVDYYINYLEKHGKEEWQDWSDYKLLDPEWENFRDVIEWCISQSDRYQDVLKLWRNVKGYTHFRGHWQERLVWLDWLIQSAQQRQDPATLAEVILDKGRTLILLGEPQQYQTGIELLNQAGQLCQDIEIVCKFDIALHLIAFCVQQEDIKQATTWLDKIETLLQQISLDTGKYSYVQSQVFYYQAQIQLKEKDYQQARNCYQQALEHSLMINWQRATTYNRLYLALIDIEQNTNLAKAEESLTQNMQIVSQNQDIRCVAYCKRAYALLEKNKGNLTKFCRWATEAKKDFHQLEMKQDEAEMNQWLSQYCLSNNLTFLDDYRKIN